MNRTERKLLVYLGKLEFNHIDDIVSRYCFDSLDDLVNALISLQHKGYARVVEHDGLQYYQRTVEGRAALSPKEYGNTDDIPF